MAKAYFRNTDKGTVFHDPTKNQTLTGGIVGVLEITPRVTQAISNHQIEKLDKEEGRKLYEDQEAQRLKDEKAAQKAAGTGPVVTMLDPNENDAAADGKDPLKEDEGEDDLGVAKNAGSALGSGEKTGNAGKAPKK